MTKSNFTQKTIVFLLATVLFLGGILRFYNLNWDGGLTFHPDERNIDAAVSRVEFFDHMDPEFFAYGGFPIYLYNATTEALAKFTKDPSWMYNWGKINYVGRTYSAIFSTITILLIFLVSKKLFNKRVGLISATLAAFTPSFIQTAHYAITESILTMMVLIITHLSIRLYERFTFKRLFLVAISLGISVASKTSGVSFSILPLFAFILKFWGERNKLRSLKKYLPFGIAFMIIVFFVFTLFSPYTFLSWDKFMESMEYESGVVNGTRPVPYTLQFTNTTPYFFQLKNIFWQIGLVAIFSYTGILLLIKKAVKKKPPLLIIFLSFPLIYFAYVGSWHTKFIRYMLPILPALLISAAYLFDSLIKKSKILGTVITFSTLLFTILWGVAFFSIYTQKQTRLAASEWAYQNIPFESTILTEHWDDGLPIDLHDIGMRAHEQYKINQLTIYEPDDSVKLDYYSEVLPTGDYMIINSRRLYGTLMNLKDKYPLTSRYYELLFDGSLGYKQAAEFSSYPNIFGLTIKDDKSEETFQVYEHNKVIIFKNISRLNSTQIKEVLSER